MSADLLIEIGTEELPPKALRGLMDAFAENIAAGLTNARLAHAGIQSYSSPRRLAVIVEQLADGQEDRNVEQKGPPVKVAFDDDGNPKPPAIAFAKKCGVDVEQLARTSTDKGEWLSYTVRETGQSISELLPGIIEQALGALPIPRRMRWGDGDAEFVRPMHWVVLLHGDQVIEASIAGIASGRTSMGHRFHSVGAVTIADAGSYLETLETEGYVIADFERRRQMVTSGVDEQAAKAGGEVVEGESLYDEVAALVEWPVPITGQFEDKYLDLPREVVVSTLTGHQRYFPVAGSDGKLMPVFITVANIESKDPAQVVDGNERVIRPRLADAEFFWGTDKTTSLADRRGQLQNVVYQQGLGSLADKSDRVGALSVQLAEATGKDSGDVVRAAELCKCDLLTGMVGEFPDLQGIMGSYYAVEDGEPETVSNAIREHYQPRFAGDELPESDAGRLLAVADRLDTLAGVFALGKKPSGNRDPFGLRRAALGVVRILIECELDANLNDIIVSAVEAQPATKDNATELASALREFILDRLRGYAIDRGASAEAFEAVTSVGPESLLDFSKRLDAVMSFSAMDEAESLAAANKRIGNILRKAGAKSTDDVDESLLSEAAESALFNEVQSTLTDVVPLLDDARYTDALKRLATLRDPVDRFFDDVMVMADDDAVRTNRLALLGTLRNLFSDVADISRLSAT